MKKITVLLFIAMLTLPAALVFADDPSSNSDQTFNAQTNQPVVNTHPPTEPPPMPPMPGMMSAKTVVATSDGGIVIVEGNKVTKLDSNLSVVKSVELSDSSSSSSS